MNTRTSGNRLIQNFCLLELLLSIPFWAIGALAHAHIIPDHVLLAASWSLTPMMTALILAYRGSKMAGIKSLFKRCIDYKRVKAKFWYLPLLLLGPCVVFMGYGMALMLGYAGPAPHFTPMVLLVYAAMLIGVYGEEIGWTAYALDVLQESHSALVSGILVGMMWASFHAPVWYLAGGMSLRWCVWQWIYVVALRVLMVWMYNNMGKSLFTMALLHPGFFVWWYLWPISSAGIATPEFYDPRNFAIITAVLAVIVVFLWGPKTLAQFRFSLDKNIGIENK